MSKQINDHATMRVQSNPHCYLCGARGIPLYTGLKDRMFGTAGEWNLKKCPQHTCGLVWLDPMPIESDIGQAYQTYYTHKSIDANRQAPTRFYKAVHDGYLQYYLGYYQGVGSLWYRLLTPFSCLYPTGPDQIALSVMFLPAPPHGSRLLDVGCGSGRLLAQMKKVGWQVEGIDFDPVALETAHARDVTVRIGSLEEQEYPDESFDAITMSHVIEHVYNPRQMIEECYRLLKRGGKLIILTPNIESWGSRHFKQDWRGLEPPRHLYLYNSINLQRMVHTIGFDCVNQRTLSKGARYILSMSQALRHARLFGQQRIGYNGPERTLHSLIYQFGERLLLQFRPNLGEELLIIAQKV